MSGREELTTKLKWQAKRNANQKGNVMSKLVNIRTETHLGRISSYITSGIHFGLWQFMQKFPGDLPSSATHCHRLRRRI